MKILAIETSSSRSSVAVLNDKTLVFSESFFSPRRETGPIFSLVHRALLSVDSIDLIAVGSGPGSYNGIRAGIALAQGLETSLAIPCAGFSSLLAIENPPSLRIVAGDARSGQFFCAAITNHTFLSPPSLKNHSDLLAFIALYPDAEKIWVGDAPLSSLSAYWTPSFPSAAALAFVASSSTDSPPPPPVPLYLKPPHITPPRSK